MNLKFKIFLILSCLMLSFPTLGKETSIISLIATPEKFEGKDVTVIGVVGLSHEVSSLYLDMFSYKHGINANSVCINVGRDNKFSDLNGVASIVHGEFRKHEYCGYVLVVKNMGISVPAKI